MLLWQAMHYVSGQHNQKITCHCGHLLVATCKVLCKCLICNRHDIWIVHSITDHYISRYDKSVIEICAPLEYYAAYSGNSLLIFQDHFSVPHSNVNKNAGNPSMQFIYGKVWAVLGSQPWCQPRRLMQAEKKGGKSWCSSLVLLWGKTARESEANTKCTMGRQRKYIYAIKGHN
jgi:hypothetical protein